MLFEIDQSVGLGSGAYLQNAAPVFERAYLRSRPLLDLVPVEKFEKAQIDLGRVLRKFPRISALANTMPDTQHVLGVTRSQILLHARADGKTRKYSTEPAWEHSLRVAESFLFIVDGLITNSAILAAGVIKSQLHDVVEDFNTVSFEVLNVEGQDVAYGVNLMTTPETEELAKQYIEHVDLSGLKKIKKGSAQEYEVIKAQLKMFFKCDMAEMLPLVEAIIKAVDNADSFHSYLQDIQSGRLKLQTGSRLGSAIKRTRRGPLILSTAEAARNIRDRTKYHEAIEHRLGKLEQKAQAYPSSFPVSAEAIDEITRRLHKYFWDKRDDFAAYVESTNSRPLLEQMRDAGRYWAERTTLGAFSAAKRGQNAISSMLML